MVKYLMYSGRLDDSTNIKWYTKQAKKLKTSRDALMREVLNNYKKKNEK